MLGSFSLPAKTTRGYPIICNNNFLHFYNNITTSFHLDHGKNLKEKKKKKQFSLWLQKILLMLLGLNYWEKNKITRPNCQKHFFFKAKCELSTQLLRTVSTLPNLVNTCDCECLASTGDGNCLYNSISIIISGNYYPQLSSYTPHPSSHPLSPFYPVIHSPSNPSSHPLSPSHPQSSTLSLSFNPVGVFTC